MNELNNCETIRQQLLDLDKKKLEIESEIIALNDVLKSQNVGLNTGKLIDREGYPRNDIDIYQVRGARQRIICLQNDHKALMKSIEEGLFALHAQIPFDPALGGGTAQLLAEAKQMRPIAEIDRVEVGSPAEQAQLRVGDRIIKFGSVNANNFRGLPDLASVVKHSVDKDLTVVIQRKEIASNQEEINETFVLKLIPKSWSGKGFLGCNIVPILKD